MHVSAFPLVVRSLILLAAAAFFTPLSGAATPGTDDASQSAYQKNGSATWNNGDNGGTGFQPWILVSSDKGGDRGFFIDDSAKLAAGSGGDINAAGKSFGLFGVGEGNSAEATRSLDSPLSAGQTFTIEIAVNYRNGNKGFDLRDADGHTLFNVNVGTDDYVVNAAATGNGSISSDFSPNTVFALSFVQTNAAGGTWTLTRRGGVSKNVSGTYKGTAAGFKLYISGAEGGSENDLMANHLSITAGATH